MALFAKPHPSSSPPREGKGRETNYLDFIPSRSVGHERDEDGRIVLLRPKFAGGLFAKILQPHIKIKYFRVRLDAFGSKTWELIDGERSVGAIADLLYEAFGDPIEPRYERLSKFIHSLHRGAIVALEQKQSTRSAAPCESK